MVGLGNPYRRDDGVGVAVASALRDMELPNVIVLDGISDPMGLVEAWSGAALAVVIDAAVATPPTPGRVRRCSLAELRAGREGLSSHGVDVARAHELAEALGREPRELVVLAVEVADTGHGAGLTRQVERAVPEAVRLAAAEIGRADAAAAARRTAPPRPPPSTGSAGA